MERLKTELISDDGAGGAFDGGDITGGAATEAGSLKLNKSLEALGTAVFTAGGAASDAKSKSPKSLDRAGARLAFGFWAGLDAREGSEFSFGPGSKNPPPLKDEDVTCGGAGVDRCEDALLTLAKGSDLADCCGLLVLVEADGLKFKSPKASSRPPNPPAA